ncbi:MAG: alpha/beta hydrolase [Oscillospiraceae bacterium]|nr:alpha/beta hydrolase [Oscillospiraceae bacterium]
MLKRVCCLIACVALLGAALVVPSQAATPRCDCDTVLQVWVDGWGQTLFFDEGTPNQRAQGPMRLNRIVRSLPGLAWGATRTALSVNPFREPFINFEPLARGFARTAENILGHLQIDEQGNSVYPLTSTWYIADQCHMEHPQFWFIYDFRQCPFESARQLNDFIEALLAHTGHRTVALTSHSQGGIIAMTYLAMFGSRRLDTFILANSAFQGVDLVGRLFTRQFGIDRHSAAAFMGINPRWTRFLPNLGNAVYVGMFDYLMDLYIIPQLATMPIVWAFLPTDYFNEAVRLWGDDPRLQHVLQGARRYHREVLGRSEQLLRQAMRNGTHVAILASYNNAPIPVSRGVQYQSDRLIGTARMSGGARVAPFGEVLPAGSGRHRSPDGIIDASTAMLPNHTWFVRDNWHCANVMYDLRMWIIHSNTQPTVWQHADFPQFLQHPGNGGQAVPLG